jgi:hypothetical protein
MNSVKIRRFRLGRPSRIYVRVGKQIVVCEELAEHGNNVWSVCGVFIV